MTKYSLSSHNKASIGISPIDEAIAHLKSTLFHQDINKKPIPKF